MRHELRNVDSSTAYSVSNAFRATLIFHCGDGGWWRPNLGPTRDASYLAPPSRTPTRWMQNWFHSDLEVRAFPNRTLMPSTEPPTVHTWI